MSHSHKIFLVEDDLSFGSVLKSYLEINEYDVTWVDDGKYAIDTFRKDKFDLCILDVMLPNIDGFTIASLIRDINRGVPIIFLTAKKLKEDVLKGYGLGADDYITKPFDTEILLAKIKAVMSRTGQSRKGNDLMKIGLYVYNRKLRNLVLNDETRKLSPKEGQLLELLAEAPDTFVSREVALKTIWGSD
ncbi:MAG: response regulator transcription factor, partial [Bacteroidales bacterium]